MDPPLKPNESDCCNSGCNPCILDVYEDQLKKYNACSKPHRISRANCLSPTSYSIFKVVDIKRYSKDCNLYTFEYLGAQRDSLGLNVGDKSVLYEPGQYLLLRGNIYGETFQKAYTPIYIEDQASNCFTVLVKLYGNGHMSRLFRSLTIGSKMLWRGPYGDFRINYEHKNMLFIAQGTGIAPFYSILCDMLNTEECYTFLTLFFCCNVENVLFRDELYKLKEFWNCKYELFISRSNKDVFKVKYNEIVHFSRLEIGNIKEFLRLKNNNCRVLICGSDSFCENIRNMLLQCCVSEEDITIF